MSLCKFVICLLVALVPGTATMAQKKKKNQRVDNLPVQVLADTLNENTFDNLQVQVLADTLNENTFDYLPIDTSLQGAEWQVAQLCDSIHYLWLHIDLLEQQIWQMQRQIAFADTCIVRQANNALYAPYDQERVNNALNAFDRISSRALCTRMQPLRKLLVDYGYYYEEMVSILWRANGDKDLKNPFCAEATAKRYINEIRQTKYFREVEPKQWIIPYLSGLVQKAIKRLEANDPINHKMADLKDLIETNP